jgi:hypothetical protein
MRQLKVVARVLRDSVYRVLYRGTGRWCPVCERPARRFAPFGIERRAEAMCPHCGALERHRLLWLVFTRMTNLFDQRPKRVLHIAPERALTPRLRRRLGPGYVTADLSDPTADVRLDVTDIQYPDESFDVVYCSHVLEHVPDDRRAMHEMRRILKQDGWGVILVPILAQRTVEDPSVTDPKERLRRFGQDDHVRIYGPDFVDRLRGAGFAVQTIEVSDVVDQRGAALMGLTSGTGEIFLARPLSSNGPSRI